MGLSALSLDAVSDEDLEMMKYAAAMLEAGFRGRRYLQIVRVYGQALAQIADAEVRLFHLYVHEPLMREGVPGRRDRRGDGGHRRARCCRSRLPLMTYLHGRFLAHFVEQDVVGHMEADHDDERERARRAPAGGDRVRRPGRLHAADRGAGDEEAVGAVERFVEASSRRCRSTRA